MPAKKGTTKRANAKGRPKSHIFKNQTMRSSQAIPRIEKKIPRPRIVPKHSHSRDASAISHRDFFRRESVTTGNPDPQDHVLPGNSVELHHRNGIDRMRAKIIRQFPGGWWELSEGGESAAWFVEIERPGQAHKTIIVPTGVLFPSLDQQPPPQTNQQDQGTMPVEQSKRSLTIELARRFVEVLEKNRDRENIMIRALASFVRVYAVPTEEVISESGLGDIIQTLAKQGNDEIQNAANRVLLRWKVAARQVSVSPLASP